MGKQWAFDTLSRSAPQYHTSDSTKKAYSLANKLAGNKSGYGKSIEANLKKYKNMGSFDPNKSAYYQSAYKALEQLYKTRGRNDMQNAVAAAAANTEGYGNSYGATAGNQAYQAQLQALAAKVPSLYATASGEFNNQKNNLATLIGLQQQQQQTQLQNAQWQVGVQQGLDAQRYQARSAQDSALRDLAKATLQYYS